MIETPALSGSIVTSGYRAADDPDRSLETLDLSFDSLLDSPTGLTSSARTLRFVRGSCMVEARVSGRTHLTVTIHTRPHGPVTVEVQTFANLRRDTVVRPRPRPLPSLHPGVTRFLIRWPHAEHDPARTAWLVL